MFDPGGRAQVNIKDYDGDSSPLGHAVRAENHVLLEMLLEAGAHPDGLHVPYDRSKMENIPL
jgi:hypothetical protein